MSKMHWECIQAIFEEHWFSFLAILVLLTISTIYIAFNIWRTSCKSQSPPGPWGLPIVGNIFLFGSSPHKNVTKLVQHYGHVFAMKLGSREVVLLNSVDAVKEALLKNGSDFSSRPPLHSFVSSSHDDKTVAWPVFGPKYLKNKRATELAMRTVLNDHTHFCETVLRETHVLIKSFLNSSVSRFDPADLLRSLAASLQFRLFFGNNLRDSYIKDSQFMMDGATDFIESSAVGNSVDFMPWIKVVFKKQVQKLDDSVAELTAFVRKIYHIKKKDLALKEKAGADNGTTFDRALAMVVSDKTTLTFRDEHSPREDQIDEDTKHFDDETMVNIMADCFGGGYEKLSTALRWAVAYLVSHRDVQAELQRELQRVKGSSPLSLQDKDKLPLLEATILEVLRLSSFMPFALPHCTTRDTSVSGYQLSKGSIVFVNLWACSRDPRYFDEPSKFNPYRFMDDKRLNLVRSSCFLSFSAGDRKCPGESYAKFVMFLVLGTLLQKLKLRNGTEDPIEDMFGLTVRPKPYKIHVEATK